MINYSKLNLHNLDDSTLVIGELSSISNNTRNEVTTLGDNIIIPNNGLFFSDSFDCCKVVNDINIPLVKGIDYSLIFKSEKISYLTRKDVYYGICIKTTDDVYLTYKHLNVDTTDLNTSIKTPGVIFNNLGTITFEQLINMLKIPSTRIPNLNNPWGLIGDLYNNLDSMKQEHFIDTVLLKV